MLHLVNALVSVFVVTAALTLSSIHRRLALLLGLAGATSANFLGWVVGPQAWSHAVAPWAYSIAGVVAAIVGWSVLRSYSGLLVDLAATPVGDDTAAVPVPVRRAGEGRS